MFQNTCIKTRIMRLLSNYSEIGGHVGAIIVVAKWLVSDARKRADDCALIAERTNGIGAAHDAAAESNGGIEATSRFSWPRLYIVFPANEKSHDPRGRILIRARSNRLSTAAAAVGDPNEI